MHQTRETLVDMHRCFSVTLRGEYPLNTLRVGNTCSGCNVPITRSRLQQQYVAVCNRAQKTLSMIPSVRVSIHTPANAGMFFQLVRSTSLCDPFTPVSPSAPAAESSAAKTEFSSEAGEALRLTVRQSFETKGSSFKRLGRSVLVFDFHRAGAISAESSPTAAWPRAAPSYGDGGGEEAASAAAAAATAPEVAVETRVVFVHDRVSEGFECTCI